MNRIIMRNYCSIKTELSTRVKHSLMKFSLHFTTQNNNVV